MFKKILTYFFWFVILCAVAIIVVKNNMYLNGSNYRIYNKIIGYIEKKIVIEKSMPVSLSKEELKKTTLIYVLGGNQESLTSRFRKASDLYHHGLSSKILILSRPGITEFSQKLERNLTNDEWAVRELQNFNVRKEDVETVSVDGKFFGTLREAKYITEIVRSKGCSILILVTSDYHTKRVFNTFSAYASVRSLELFIFGSNYPAGFLTLLYEYVKLLLYDYFLIPLYTGSMHKPPGPPRDQVTESAMIGAG